MGAVTGFVGGSHALRWAFRDVRDLDQVLALVPGRTAVVQAGGNLGVFPAYLAQHFAAVYTFEPAAELFPLLVQNAPHLNIYRFQAALGETTGLVSTVRTRRHTTPGPVHEGLTHIGTAPGLVPLLPLDALALPTVDLLCLDLEGYEWYALRGAQQTITQCRPVIVCEVNQNCEFYGLTRERVRACLTDQGYRGPVLRLHSDEVFLPC